MVLYPNNHVDSFLTRKAVMMTMVNAYILNFQLDVTVHAGKKLPLHAGVLTYHVSEENTEVIIGSVVAVLAVTGIAAAIGKEVIKNMWLCVSLSSCVSFVRSC